MGCFFIGLGGDSGIYTADVKDARPVSARSLLLTSSILMLSLTIQQMGSAKVIMGILRLSLNFTSSVTSSVRECFVTQGYESFMRIPRHCAKYSWYVYTSFVL